MKINRENLAKTYSKMGAKYLRDISKAKIPEIPEFMASLPKQGKILEIGCAGGRDAKIFVKNKFDYTGIDLVPLFLKEAKKAVPKGTFLKMDVTKLKFPKNSFDGIWASAVLLHLNKPEVPKTLKQMNKVLKSGGIIYICVKRGQGTSQVKEKLSQGNVRAFTFFYKKEIEALVKQAGFTITKSTLLPDFYGRPKVSWITLLAKKNKTSKK